MTSSDPTSRTAKILALKAKLSSGAEDAEFVDLTDPLDKRAGGWAGNKPSANPFQKTIADYHIAKEAPAASVRSVDVVRSNGTLVMDGTAMDDSTGMIAKTWNVQDNVSPGLMGYFASQGFIGYQACAIIAQNWLVDKACSMPARDAVRNGYEVQAADGQDLSPEMLDALSKADIKFKLKQNCIELVRYSNMFGIRIALFEFDLDMIGDKNFYEKPWNPDSIVPGSYLGMSQVDPYWVMPILDSKASGSPADKDFYVPTYWIISGKKYHKSHLVIVTTEMPSDILKPTYIFGGIPLTQKIYERVYAAERTANEAPLLAMTKRTTALHVDLKKVAANQGAFESRMAQWVSYRDNQGVRVLGTGEQIEQLDTSLADLDAAISSQYQLVAAIAEIPATKLLGTSPKGFGASGDYELASYRERLETFQECLSPLVDRHHICLIRSEIAPKFGIPVFETEVVWHPVDSLTAEKLAAVNKTKAETGAALIASGAISPDDERQRIRNDKESGYTGLTDEEADTTLAKAEATEAEGEAAEGNGDPTGATGDPLADLAALSGGDADPLDDLKALSEPEGDAMSDFKSLSETETDPLLGMKEIAGTYTDPLGSLKELSTDAGMNQEPGGVADPLDKLRTMSKANPLADLRKIGSSPPPELDPSEVPKATACDVSLNQSAQLRAALPRVLAQGMTVVIENRAGSIRSGENEDGPWRTVMPVPYGYIDKVPGADGDDLDVFLGPNEDAPFVYVINQINALTGEFDECKCMVGFGHEDEALKAYMDSYSDNYGEKIFDEMFELTVDEFKEWTETGDTTRKYSFAEHTGGGGFGIAELIASDPSQETALNTENQGGESLSNVLAVIIPLSDELKGPQL